MPYRFSPSTLSLLKDCPRCFWLQFNRKIKRPSGIFPSLPSGMDRILKQHFDSFIGKKTLPPELSSLEGSVKLFGQKELLEQWRKNTAGIRWKDEEGNLLMGAIDSLLEKQGKLIVLDYKTRGYPLKKGFESHYQHQLDTYNFLLRKNGFETEDYSYLLFYHPDRINESGDVVFNKDLIKIRVFPKNALLLFESALKILREPCPKNNKCEWCKNILQS